MTYVFGSISASVRFVSAPGTSTVVLWVRLASGISRAAMWAGLTVRTSSAAIWVGLTPSPFLAATWVELTSRTLLGVAVGGRQIRPLHMLGEGNPTFSFFFPKR